MSFIISEITKWKEKKKQRGCVELQLGFPAVRFVVHRRGVRAPMQIIGTCNALGRGGIETHPLLASVRLLQHHRGTVRRSCKLQCRAASEARSQDGTMLPGPAQRVLASKKLGSLYLTLLPGHLQYLPAFLAPASVLISLEGSVHGAEWSRWLLGLLPVPQVR